jgi:hypothetical protein
MIVNYTEKGWQIITQRAHGLLSGQFCFYLKPEFRPKYWMETIVATIEHDDAFNELESDEILLNENGGPVNFKMRDFEKDKCDKLMNLALTKSRYIALLTSRHIRFLYEKSEEAAVKSYCTELKKQDQKRMKELDISAKEIEDAYLLLQWCDALSLLICQKMIQPENRKIEISIGPGAVPYHLLSPAEDVLSVDPWPFEPDQFDISFDTRILPELVFESEDVFRKKLLAQEPEPTFYHFSKSQKSTN